MTETLKQDLQSLRCEGNIAYLPTEKLNDYPTLKKTLIQATGKYKRNTFEFPTFAKPIIDLLLSGKTINFKKDFQFFATPAELAQDVVNQLYFASDNFDVLEPSAGHGALIDALLPSPYHFNIDAIELSSLNASILKEKYSGKDNISVHEGDFLTMDLNKKYDIIIANPPFTSNQDIDHIRKMFTLLKDHGQLVTIASNSWTFGSQKKQVAFREWVEEYGQHYDINNGAFKASGTNVSATLLTFYK